MSLPSSDLVFAREVAKYAARGVYGLRREEPEESELLKMLNKQMILQVLGDVSCLEELTTDEQDELQGVLILKS